MWEICYKHCMPRLAGEQCVLCVSEQSRDTINVLESRIADQDDIIARLCRQVTELQHWREADLKAHNAFVSYIMSLT